SMVVGPDGELLARAEPFTERLLVADLTPPAATTPPRSRRVDAKDGTSITIEHTVISADPVPAYRPAPPPVAEPLDDLAEVYGALVPGVRDYVRKNGFRSVICGLSGGIDSALVATVAADAIGPENVHVVLLPSRYSSEHSVADAE